MDRVFKALADESRRELLDKLYARNGQSLNELCEHLEMSRQAVTKHLGILEEANLISTLWHGREKFHYINPVPIQEIYNRWIKKYEAPMIQAITDLKEILEQPESLSKEKHKSKTTTITHKPQKTHG